LLVFPQEGISQEVIKVRIEDLVLIAMDVLCVWDLRFDHDLLGKAFNFAKSAFFRGSCQRNGNAGASCPTCVADAVHEDFRVIREVKIGYMRVSHPLG